MVRPGNPMAFDYPVNSVPQVQTNTDQAIAEPDWQFVADCLRAARIHE